jgi:xanthine dehydrogenase YagS FAD-binding subunit
MTRFTYHRPESLTAALGELADPHALPIAGGTDLLPCVDEGLAAPGRVVDIRSLPELGGVMRSTDGGIRIGAGVRIAELARHPLLQAEARALADAAASVGSPALRNMGTLGGNLAQRQHCWYLRRGVHCFKNGGTACAAVEGEHAYHAILTTGTCHAVHPSDPAVALEALDASVVTSRRRLRIADFFHGAASNATSEHVLERGELILAVEVPAAACGGVQHWEKVIQRGAFDFALVSCAAVRRVDGAVRMSLGGVAAGPWRVPLSVEEDVASGGLDDESLDALAERALYDAQPLPGTAYKVWIAQAVLRRAMRAIGARNQG